MRKLLFLTLLPSLAFGQPVPNTVTVTAARNSTLAPDQVVFGIDVAAPISSTRDDALTGLDGSGITIANFSGVRTTQIYTGSQTQTQIVWSFTLTADFTALKDTIGTLTAIQQRVAARNNGMSVSFSVQGTQVSTRLAQTQQCVLGDLISDARAQAQKLAGSAGMGLGSIVAISSATSSTAAGFGSLISTPACTLTVKFALGAF